MWLIVGHLPLKTVWWDAPPAPRDFNRSNKHCQSTNSCPPLLLKINMIKQESIELATNGNQDGVPQIGYKWSQPLYYLQLLLLRRVIMFYISVHKVLEQPWRHFTSLKLWKCSQIPHPSIRVASTSRRWHMLRFDTGWEGGKTFRPISKLPGLTCVICCNQGLFFSDNIMIRDCYFPATLLKKRLWHRYFSVNFAKFLRSTFLQNTSGRLLLKCVIIRDCFSQCIVIRDHCFP